jgi:hypothetical protein
VVLLPPTTRKKVSNMRKLIVLVVLALAVPVAALADDAAPTASSTANATCKQERTTLGATQFTATYGTNAGKTNAFGKCVSEHAKSAHLTVTNAAKTCKAQQADQNFATEPGHDGKTFDQFYGTNGGNGKGSAKNAYGKCVSQAVSSAVTAQAKAAKAAVKTCKASLKSDAAAFAKTYGSGKDALGKCVAAGNKTK